MTVARLLPCAKDSECPEDPEDDGGVSEREFEQRHDGLSLAEVLRVLE